MDGWMDTRRCMWLYYMLIRVSFCLSSCVFQFGDNPTREMMTILVEKIDDPSDNLFVFFPEDTKVGVKPIRKCVHHHIRCHEQQPTQCSLSLTLPLCIYCPTATATA